MPRPDTLALYACALITVLFQAMQFWELWVVASERWEDEMALAVEDVCTNPSKKYRYRARVDCAGASRGAGQTPLGAAFQDWVQSRYLFLLITLSDWTTKVSVLLLLAWILYLVLGRRGSAVAVHVSPPGLGAPPAPLALAEPSSGARWRLSGRRSSSRALVPLRRGRRSWSDPDSGGSDPNPE